MRVTDVLKVGFEKGQVYGIIQERKQWETAGHSQTCFFATSSSTVTTNAGTQVDLVTPSCSDSSTQTSSDFNPLDDPESVDLLCALSAIALSSTPLGFIWHHAFQAGAQAPRANISDDVGIPPCVDTSIQTTEPPLPVTPLRMQDASSQTSPHLGPTPDSIHIPSPLSPPLNWADDVVSLPSLPILPPPVTFPPTFSNHPPHNLSALCSSSPKPFSSIQCRNKQS